MVGLSGRNTIVAAKGPSLIHRRPSPPGTTSATREEDSSQMGRGQPNSRRERMIRELMML